MGRATKGNEAESILKQPSDMLMPIASYLRSYTLPLDHGGAPKYTEGWKGGCLKHCLYNAPPPNTILKTFMTNLKITRCGIDIITSLWNDNKFI